jgi:glycogen debranching enzyme
MPVEAPDLNTYLCLQLEALGRMARVIGEEQDAARWEKEADEVARRMVEAMWDPGAGMFWATHLGEPVRIKTPFSLFPMLTGRLPAEIVRRLVAALHDEQTFWTRFPVATVARDDPHYDPLQMWRGPTWINTNYLLMEGLERVGEQELARDLRRRSLELVMQMGDFSEYYHPETGEKPPKAASIFGWTASLFIEMALRESEEE